MPRLLPPVLLILAMGLMLFLHRAWPGPHLPASAWRAAIGLSILATGLGVAQWHARLFHRRGTAIHTFATPQVLVTSGLFGISRNPMYLGFVLALAGLGLLLGATTPWAVVLAFAAVVDRWYIRHEEAVMASMFGQAYRDYRRRVRRWL